MRGRRGAPVERGVCVTSVRTFVVEGHSTRSAARTSVTKGETPMKRLQDWQKRAVSAAEVVAHLRSRHRVFVHGAAATPTTLLEAMLARSDLEQVELYHIHLNRAIEG